MSEHSITLPDVGEGIAEAEIVEWHVAVGDSVAEDELLGAVMTDKAAVDIPSPVAGKVLLLGGTVGDILAVGAEYVRLQVAGDGVVVDTLTKDTLTKDTRTKDTAAAVAVEPVPAPTEPGTPSVPAEPVADAEPLIAPQVPARRPRRRRMLASPAVRRRAHEHGVALHFVTGSGPGGRISHDDLDRYLAGGDDAPRAGLAAAPPDDVVDEVRLVGLRRQIAEQMQRSKSRIPHFSYVEETDVTTLEELRTRLNSERKAEQPKLSLLPFLMLAIVRSVAEFPQMNARFDDEAGVVRRHSGVHIGVAVQTPGGLMVPVVRHAETLDVWQLANAIAELAEVVRAGKARREQVTGGTITLTSLGALGGIVSTPVINHPEVAIVGVNRIVTRPVFSEDVVVPRKLMNLSSSFDHRVVDGYDAAAFIARIRGFIEVPSTIFIGN